MLLAKDANREGAAQLEWESYNIINGSEGSQCDRVRKTFPQCVYIEVVTECSLTVTRKISKTDSVEIMLACLQMAHFIFDRLNT